MWILIILIILITLIIFIACNYLYNIVINTKTDKSFILNNDNNRLSKELLDGMKEGSIWFKKTTKKETYITSFDGIKLHAYELIKDNNIKNWVILSHGYFGHAEQVALGAKNLLKHNYNVLIVEARGHGKSEGNYIGMGWHDRLDILSWIDYLNNNYNDINIILYGVSMGAATTMMTSGEVLPSNVICAISDCSYTSAIEEFSYQIKSLFHLPPFPIINIFNIIVKIRAGYSLKDVDALNQLKKSKIPMLIIHGDKDTFVPPYMAQKLYEVNPQNKKILIVEGAGHGESCVANSKLYWDTICDFIKNNIN
jgi:hypothetical protein